MVIALLVIGIGFWRLLSKPASAQPPNPTGPKTVAVVKVVRKALKTDSTLQAEFIPYQDILVHAKVSGPTIGLSNSSFIAAHQKPSLITATWEGYKKAGPLLISTDHRGTADGGPFHEFFSDVAVKLTGSHTWINAQ